MIVKDTSQGRQNHRIAYLLTGLGLCCAMLWYLFGREPQDAPTSYSTIPQGAAYCSAETVKDSQLFNSGINFGSAKLQSNVDARTGQYSCRLPAVGKTAYGFGYKLKNPAPGQSYKASVWRKKNVNNAGFLVVSMAGEHQAYLQENNSSIIDTAGWEQLQLRFSIPYQKSVEEVSIYVYSQGHTEVLFDDLLIAPLFSDSAAVFQPAVLNLTLGREAMAKLESKRQEALKRGILVTEDKDWVEAQLTEKGQEAIPVEVRLKGDWLDHLRGEKWSFRLKAKDGHTWRRMRSFSMHTPLARHFLSEWLLHQLWEREEVLTTRYDFVELRVNGKSLGVYAYEEHFEKQLLEYRQRREGPILKLSEAAYWQSIGRQLQEHGFVAPVEKQAVADWTKAPIEAFKEKSLLENPVLAEQFEEAKSLLYQYQTGRTAASEVFDIQQVARYYAICDILNGYHGIIWHNQRFYYNPITSLLEPIGFDGFGGPPERKYSLLGAGALHPSLAENGQLFSGMLLDTAFAAAYLYELYRMSDDTYLQPFLDSLYPHWSARLEFIQTEFADYQPNLESVLTEAQYLHSILLPIEGFSLAAYRKEGSVQVENRHSLPIEIIGYGYKQSTMAHELSEPILIPGAVERKYLQRLKRDQRIDNFQRVRFLEQGAIKEQSPPLFFELDLPVLPRFLFYRLPGTSQRFSCEVQPAEWPAPRIKAQELRKQAQLKEEAIYQIAGRQLIFSPGRYLLKENMVIPAGYSVVFQAGTQIELAEGVHFISFSPIKAFGTEEAPVRIFSKAGAGHGFTVLQAEGLSELSHVSFDGLNTLNTGGWRLTGAVTFYESDVNFHRCSFTNNQCEDGLNIIRSNFNLSQSLISNTTSDGLDADFCKGEIHHCQFINTANDGVDFSGSIVNMTNCRMENNGDKGISVGEESDVTVFDSKVIGAPIAVASKDLSVLYLRNISIASCRQGFVAYQKKPEFGGANIIVESYEAVDVKRLYAISEGSRLQLGDEIVE